MNLGSEKRSPGCRPPVLFMRKLSAAHIMSPPACGQRLCYVPLVSFREPLHWHFDSSTYVLRKPYYVNILCVNKPISKMLQDILQSRSGLQHTKNSCTQKETTNSNESWWVCYMRIIQVSARPYVCHEQEHALSLYLTDPTAIIANIQQAVKPSINHLAQPRTTCT